jgi:phosphate:Na+ symporter
MIQKMNFDRLEDFKLNEERIDYLNKEVARFLVKLSNQSLSSSDSIYVSTAYKSLTDLERIGDYAENIVEYAVKMKDTGEGFSSIALDETAKVEQMVEDLYDKILLAYTNKDRRSLEVAYDMEEQIDVFTDEMAANHIKRLNDGVCTLDVGAKYLALASDTERVADHLINFGKTIRDLKPHSQ